MEGGEVWMAMGAEMQFFKGYSLLASLACTSSLTVNFIFRMTFVAPRQPLAFLSYVRTDDDHDGGRITRFRERLEGEVRMQTGRKFPIFQDRNDLSWGQNWDEVIKTSLADVTFLIPIITPSFFHSPACRSEFEVFRLKELSLGINRLILPLYYVNCDQMISGGSVPVDPLANVLLERQYTDWRPFRFKQFEDEVVAVALSKLATTIKDSIEELESIMEVESPSRSAAALSKGGLAGKKEVAVTGAARGKPAGRSPARKSLAASVSAKEVSPAEKSDVNVVEIRGPGKVIIANIVSKERPKYFAYTKKHDEIIDARDLSSPDELSNLNSYLNKVVNKLKEENGDSIDKFEGKFSKISLEGVSITFAIDNSGSMRGSPISYTAAWVAIMVDMLEKFGAKTEVLGYTTRAWKGGQSKELWVKDGRPGIPGRLNDLRHIIFKKIDQSVPESVLDIGVMLKEGLLKENIDGESFLWCLDRVRAVPAKKKLLVVISDGAPVDDATIQESGDLFLVSHAARISKWISEQHDLDFIIMDIDPTFGKTYLGTNIVSSHETVGLDALNYISGVMGLN